MLIAQITDSHVIEESLLLFGRIDTNGMLDAAIEAILAHTPAIDAVLVTGDLTNDGAPAQIGAFLARIDRLSMPVFVVPGNHDDRNVLRALAEWEHLPSDGPLCYAADLGPLRLIALDSSRDDVHSGLLGSDQLAWLDARLAEQPERPTLVMLHHPPFLTGIGHMDRVTLEDAVALEAVIARHPQVERVLCGHMHRPIQRRFGGTIAMTAPSCAHQVALNLEPGADGRWIFEPPAMLLHHFDAAGGALVTHQAYIGDYGGVRSFGGPNLPRT